MRAGVYDKTTGRILWTVESETLEPIAAQQTESLGVVDLDPGESGETHWVDGSLSLRPPTGLPAEHTLAPGAPWTIPDVPAGTAVVVDGIEVATTDAPGLTLSRSVPFTVELRPPFPWRGGTCRVMITE